MAARAIRAGTPYRAPMLQASVAEMERQVIKAHRSSFPKPIEFKFKDSLKVGVEDTEYPGWVWVETEDGNEGWAPVEYVEVFDDATQGIAKRSYFAKELDVEIGEVVQVDITLSGWLYVTNSRGEAGWVPQHCVHI